MHYRLMYPSEYLNAADLNGKEVTVTIEKVTRQEIPEPGTGKKKVKPVLHFKGATKTMPLPKTCAKVIAGAYGPECDAWAGKQITIYPDTCTSFGEHNVPCVRVSIPTKKGG